MNAVATSNEANLMSLRGMVDVALGTPEVGSVNFNMLHTLLHALISKLDLDNTIITSSTDEVRPEKLKSSAKIISVSTTPFHLLQDRIKIIEKQISDLNSLPSNKEIIEDIFGSENKTVKNNENKRLVSDLWQTLNIGKKVKSCEEGIDRLTSFIDTLLEQMIKLRFDNDAMKKRLDDLEAVKDDTNRIDGLQNDIKNLIAENNTIKDSLLEYPSPEFFKNVVTWEGLEKGLNGIKEEINELNRPPERIVVNVAAEDDVEEEKVVEKLFEKDDEISDKKIDEKVQAKAIPEHIKTYEAYLEWIEDRCRLKLSLPVDDVVLEVNRLIEAGLLNPNIIEGEDEVVFNLKIPLKDVQSKDKSDRKLIWKLCLKSEESKRKIVHSDVIEMNIPLTKWQLLQASVQSIPNVDVIDGIDHFVIDVPIENDNLIKRNVSTTKPLSRPSSEINAGPSKMCADMLENLGALRNAHRELDKRVVILEEEMPNKADKKDFEKFSEDILSTINQLKSRVETLMSVKNKDSPLIIGTDNDTLSRIRDILDGLEERLTTIAETVDKVSNENKDMSTLIDELFRITTDHESRKADIGYVDGQLRLKAEKSMLDTKVNFSLFDETSGNLHNLIDDVLRKLLVAEEELRNLLRGLASDLNGKANRDDLNALKDWIEKRLLILSDKLKNLRGISMNEDDAAGLRKQLLQHFHCISCDRPVEMIPQGLPYAIGLPNPKSMHSTKPLRPYTTFELDSIRQQPKGTKNVYIQNHTKRYGSDIIDVYQTPRPCGGSHTTTYSHKKMVRLGNFNTSNSDEEVEPRGNKDEVDAQGIDGQLFRGRPDRNQNMFSNNNVSTDQIISDKLPPVPMQQRSQTMMINNCMTPRGGFITSRPKSAIRLTPRPATGNGRSESSGLIVHVPDSRPATPIRHCTIIERGPINEDEAAIASDNFEFDTTIGANNESVPT